jgi:hypothetical protein
MPGRDIIQCLLALLDQWRHCSDGLKSFQIPKTKFYLNISGNINPVTQYYIPEELNHKAVNKWFHYREHFSCSGTKTGCVTVALCCLLIQVLKWLLEIDSENRAAVNHTAVHLLHVGYCDAASALLDVLLSPTFETLPSFSAFLINEMVKTNMVRTLFHTYCVGIIMYSYSHPLPCI